MQYKNYDSTLENLKADLKKNGVAVLPNIINASEIENMKKGMWNMLAQLTKKFKTPITENNPSSWQSFYDFMPLHSMLLQHYGMGHAQFIWDLRQNKKIIDVFSHLWDSKAEDLLTSFDGLSIHFPPEITKRGYNLGRFWLHTDQSYQRNSLECIQSFVTAFDIEEGDATLNVLEKSHLYHKQFAKKFGVTSSSDWFKINDQEHYNFYTSNGCNRYAIKCGAGSLVLWDSRTIHSGIESFKNRLHPKIRLVVYICMTPRKYATDKNLEKKKQAFNNLRTTSHWPHKPKLFPKFPRSYGNELPDVTPLSAPVLNELGFKLAGF